MHGSDLKNFWVPEWISIKFFKIKGEVVISHYIKAYDIEFKLRINPKTAQWCCRSGVVLVNERNKLQGRR